MYSSSGLPFFVSTGFLNGERQSQQKSQYVKKVLAPKYPMILAIAKKRAELRMRKRGDYKTAVVPSRLISEIVSSTIGVAKYAELLNHHPEASRILDPSVPKRIKIDILKEIYKKDKHLSRDTKDILEKVVQKATFADVIPLDRYSDSFLEDVRKQTGRDPLNIRDALVSGFREVHLNKELNEYIDNEMLKAMHDGQSEEKISGTMTMALNLKGEQKDYIRALLAERYSAMRQKAVELSDKMDITEEKALEVMHESIVGSNRPATLKMAVTSVVPSRVGGEDGGDDGMRSRGTSPVFSIRHRNTPKADSIEDQAIWSMNGGVMRDRIAQYIREKIPQERVYHILRNQFGFSDDFNSLKNLISEEYTKDRALMQGSRGEEESEPSTAVRQRPLGEESDEAKQMRLEWESIRRMTDAKAIIEDGYRNTDFRVTARNYITPKLAELGLTDDEKKSLEKHEMDNAKKQIVNTVIKDAREGGHYSMSDINARLSDRLQNLKKKKDDRVPTTPSERDEYYEYAKRLFQTGGGSSAMENAQDIETTTISDAVNKQLDQTRLNTMQQESLAMGEIQGEQASAMAQLQQIQQQQIVDSTASDAAAKLAEQEAQNAEQGPSPPIVPQEELNVDDLSRLAGLSSSTNPNFILQQEILKRLEATAPAPTEVDTDETLTTTNSTTAPTTTTEQSSYVTSPTLTDLSSAELKSSAPTSGRSSGSDGSGSSGSSGSTDDGSGAGIDAKPYNPATLIGDRLQDLIPSTSRLVDSSAVDSKGTAHVRPVETLIREQKTQALIDRYKHEYAGQIKNKAEIESLSEEMKEVNRQIRGEKREVERMKLQKRAEELNVMIKTLMGENKKSGQMVNLSLHRKLKAGTDGDSEKMRAMLMGRASSVNDKLKFLEGLA